MVRFGLAVIEPLWVFIAGHWPDSVRRSSEPPRMPSPTVARAQITNTSAAITIIDHSGWYGSQKNWPTAETIARAMPSQRAHSWAAKMNRPAITARAPMTRCIHPHPVRSSW